MERCCQSATSMRTPGIRLATRIPGTSPRRTECEQVSYGVGKAILLRKNGHHFAAAYYGGRSHRPNFLTQQP
jgi:hypothetical protein